MDVVEAWKAAAKTEIPKAAGNYMKFEKGDNKFRILTAPILGYIYFSRDNKPVRAREEWMETPSDIKKDGKVKFFWAFVVWNYAEGKLQVLEVTQSTILRSIQDLVNSEDYGDPTGYDINVKRTGEGLDTEYSVIPLPPKARPLEAVKALSGASIDLSALFDGGDPFAGKVGKVVKDSIEYPQPEGEIEAF